MSSRACPDLQRNLLSVANRNRHREQPGIGLHATQVVLQVLRVRGGVVGYQYPAGSQLRYHQLQVCQVAGAVGVEENDIEWTGQGGEAVGRTSLDDGLSPLGSDLSKSLDVLIFALRNRSNSNLKRLSSAPKWTP